MTTKGNGPPPNQKPGDGLRKHAVIGNDEIDAIVEAAHKRYDELADVGERLKQQNSARFETLAVAAEQAIDQHVTMMDQFRTMLEMIQNSAKPPALPAPDRGTDDDAQHLKAVETALLGGAGKK